MKFTVSIGNHLGKILQGFENERQVIPVKQKRPSAVADSLFYNGKIYYFNFPTMSSGLTHASKSSGVT